MKKSKQKYFRVVRTTQTIENSNVSSNISLWNCSGSQLEKCDPTEEEIFSLIRISETVLMPN